MKKTTNEFGLTESEQNAISKLEIELGIDMSPMESEFELLTEEFVQQGYSLIEAEKMASDVINFEG
tara:strand:- start:26 stop:223 length:198 start_codon:yes stop_codon:yes gene_type:complete